MPINMRLSLYIGLYFLIDITGANLWKERERERVEVPSQGQKLGPLNSALPIVRFECNGRGGGYYGDMDFGCSVFHYCTTGGQRFTFRCSKGLKFNEMTTSCSAGFFGDCTHPEIVGSAGRNMTTEVAPVKSFQNIPVFKGDENSFEDDPRDYPEPFIQHYDPALDIEFDEYDYEEKNRRVQDAQPSASNTVSSGNYLRQDPTWNTGMKTALSSFASLVNIPLDNPFHNANQQTDRMDHVESIERAFLARPPHRSPLIQRENHGPFVKSPDFKSSPKKPSRIAHYPGHRQNLIPVHPPSPYSDPPSEHYNNPEDKFREVPTSMQYQNIIPYDSEDAFISPEHSIRQTTPDVFRPSSLLTDDPEEFQPVTPASRDKLTEHTRPYREANPQSNHNSFPSPFQSFPTTPDPFNPPRFSGQNSFRGLPPPQRVINTTPPGFFPTPQFPSTGNFVFNQPPIHPAIFNTPFTSNAAPSGPPISRPRPSSHTEEIFEQTPPEQHTHFIRPRPSDERHFVRPTSEQHFVQPPTLINGQTFISPTGHFQSSPFSHSSNPRPVTPPPIPSFIHHTTPSPIPNFASTPIRSSFHPQPTLRPILPFNRPTLAPAFIPATSPASFDTVRQNPFGLQQERPLLESIPNIIRQSTELPAAGLPASQAHELEHPDFSIDDTSTPKSLAPSLFGVQGSSELSKEILKEPGQFVPESQGQGNLPPSFDPRPSRRRRPVTLRPSVTRTRTTSRPLRQNNPINPSRLNPTLVTGLENSEFHSQFLQPDGKWPGSQEPDDVHVDTYTVFDDTQLRETQENDPDNSESSREFEGRFTGTSPRGTTEKSLETGSSPSPAEFFSGERIIEEDTDNNVIHGNDYDDLDVIKPITPTASPATSPPTSTDDSAKEERPLLRRRPNLRNRLRNRLNLRTTTTPEPAHSNENVVAEEDNEKSIDNSESDDLPTEAPSTAPPTTLSPFRQRVRNRLNLFKNRNQNTGSARTTTNAPPVDESEDKDKTAEKTSEVADDAPKRTTAAPTSLRAGIDSDRFQRYRNKLRQRYRNSRTTVKPDVSGEETKEEQKEEEKPSNAASPLSDLRNKRINPLRSQIHSDDANEEEEVDQEPESKENVLLVKEILSSDQQTEETRQTISKEVPPSLEYPTISEEISEDNTALETTAIDDYEETPVVEDSNTDNYPITPQENEGNAEETPEHDEEDNPQNTSTKGRRIINPNFRARFREFIKNRKNRLSASYSTTAAPEAAEKQLDVTESTSTTTPEASTLSFKDRMLQFNKNRQNVRQRFLANRQANEEDRSSRRIPLRPLRNKIPSEGNNEDQQVQDKDEDLTDSLNVEESDDISEDRDSDNPQQIVRNRVIRPINKVTVGFTPALNPIHVKTPMMAHLPHDEPEIITAPTPANVGDVFTVQVSSSLGGDPELKSEKKENSGEVESDILPIDTAVKEIGRESAAVIDKPPITEDSTDTNQEQEHLVEPLERDSVSHSTKNNDDHPSDTISDVFDSQTTLGEEDQNVQSQQQPKSVDNDNKSESRIPLSSLENEGTIIQHEDEETVPGNNNQQITTDEAKEPHEESSAPEHFEASETFENLKSDTGLAFESSVETQRPKASKPTFNLGVSHNRNKNNEETPISASDYSGEFSESISPVPLLPITMSTDPPRLPLEMLLPLFNR